MKCDYCGKSTALLEELDYCSVCTECYDEVIDVDDLPIISKIDSISAETPKDSLKNE
jgi:hypothetical protein